MSVVFAIGSWMVLVGAVVWGSFAGWLCEQCEEQRMERLRQLGDRAWRDDELAAERAAVRQACGWLEAMAGQLDEIHGLPTIEPWERWVR